MSEIPEGIDDWLLAQTLDQGPRYYFMDGTPAPTRVVFSDGTDRIIDWEASKGE